MSTRIRLLPTACTVWRTSCLLAALVFLPLNASSLAGQIPELFKLELPGGTNYDDFGYSVAVDGKVAVVGVPVDDTAAGVDAGSVEVYRYSDATKQWEPEQQLFASDAAAADNFGIAVAISGNVIAVGAHLDDTATGSDSGSVHVFRYDGRTWVEEQKIVSSGAAGDTFGRSVALSGDYLMVGAPQDDTGHGVDSGAVYFYKYRGVVLKWAFDGEKDGEAAYDAFGFSVAIDGDLAVVGAYAHDTVAGADAGAAYVYRYVSNLWTIEAVLTASDGAAGDQLGISVAADDDLVVAGAYLDDQAALYDAGSAYVYRRIGGTWTEDEHLFASNGAAYDHFGRSVAVGASVVVVGADANDAPATDSGSAYLFRYIGPQCGWVEDHELVSRTAGAYDYLGTSVALSGNLVLAGVPLDDVASGYDAGSVNLYDAVEIALDIEPRSVGAGQTLTFTTGYGESNEVFMLAVTVPFTYFLLSYGSDGQSVLPVTVPPGIPPGTQLTFQAYELVECPNRAASSNPVTVTFQ
ncbi:MAG: hypothetical protein U1E76_25070 [Planctomycetota bacterium]